MWGYVETIAIYTFILGAIYLLISLGFSLIVGVLRIFHLGYSYIFPFAIYGTWMFMQVFGWDLIPSILGMIVLQFAFGAVLYKWVIKKYLSSEDVLLTALLLVALIIAQTANYFYPIQEGVYLNTTIREGTVQMGDVIVPAQLMVSAVIALALTGLIILFFLKSRAGMAVRAISQDIYSSKIVGINVEVLNVLTMMGVLLPVIIGTLLVAPVWEVSPEMGMLYMNTAILVAVLGGLGNIKGTIIASFLIGLVHAIMCFVVGEPRFMNLSALVLVIFVLIIRPQGLARSETLW